MSELGSAIDALRAETLPELADGRIEEDLVDLQRASELIELERLRRVAEIERRGSFGAAGYLSITAWLVDRCRMGWGAARDQVRMARGLQAMTATRAAVHGGELSMAAARVLVEAREADPEAFADAEAALVDAARIHPVGELRRVVAFWKDRVERDHAHDREDPRSARRRLHASVTLAGMVRVDGDLDPTTGESLLTALGAVLDAETRTRGPRTIGRLPSVGPTLWGRSAGGSWTGVTDRWWPGSDPTSRSRSVPRCSLAVTVPGTEPEPERTCSGWPSSTTPVRSTPPRPASSPATPR